jgi:predicted membrane protein
VIDFRYKKQITVNWIMCAVMAIVIQTSYKKKFDAVILIIGGRHRNQNTVFRNSTVCKVTRSFFLFFFFINKTSMIQAKTSAHIVHIHRKAAAGWAVGGLRRRK